ncbi:Nuclease EXOG, mitochondrial [Geodia barretti]|nr:Nuclease EXOG, mitochondrial [Geodia barretti]
MFCRDLAEKYPAVYVTSGPLYLPSPSLDDGGKKFVKYQVIGAGKVAVPTHLYKVILAETDDSSDPASQPPPSLGVFVVPNKPLGDEELTSFQTTLTELETLCGISFHSKLDRSNVSDLCKTDKCKLMTTLELKQFVYSLRLGRAKSEEQIGEILDEAKKEGLERDSVIAQSAAQQGNKLNTSATNGS